MSYTVKLMSNYPQFEMFLIISKATATIDRAYNIINSTQVGLNQVENAI